MAQTGIGFAQLCEEYPGHLESDRERKPSTMRGYRSIIGAYLLPTFGGRLIETATATEIEAWRCSLRPVAASSAKWGSARPPRLPHRRPRGPVGGERAAGASNAAKALFRVSAFGGFGVWPSRLNLGSVTVRVARY